MLAELAHTSAGDTVQVTADVVLGEVQTLLLKLEHLCSQMRVAASPAPIIKGSDIGQSLRELRHDRGWAQTEVIVRLRRLSHEELPYDLLNQYKRWERGRNAPSHFYAHLLRGVFGVDNIAFPRLTRRGANAA